jgi:hypothetical protein
MSSLNQEKVMSMTEAEMDQLAEKAAEKAIKRMTEEAYREVGRQTLKGVTYIVGVLTLVCIIWLANHGYLKLP